MAKLSIKAGSTDVTIYVRVLKYNSSATPLQPATALTNSSITSCYYVRQRSAATSITLNGTGAVTDAHNDGKFQKVDDTNFPGLYRLDLPDAVCATGSPYAIVNLKMASTTNAPVDLEIELTGWDNQDSVRGGMTALPNAAAEASGGLFTRGTGAGQINQDANGRIDANAKAVNGTAQTARDIGASVLLSSGTGTGQLDFTSGVVKANAVQLLGTAWLTPGTAGTPDVNAKLIGATAQTGVDLGATRAEPGQGTPGATISFLSKIDYLYKAWRNKKTQTGNTFSLFNDDAATVDQKATSTDDGTTTTITEIITGP